MKAVSSDSAAAGEIKCAKSVSDNLDLARLSRTAAAPAVSDFRTSDGTGRELNSATKLMIQT